ncbi:hypothetical protein IT407_05170 [Candidatus Uhrbacteria bacterium]|nr:hypothetical protein [Candidatus Uhrbacteria bacterium]
MFLSGCLLDRSVLGCPVGTMRGEGEAGCIPQIDGDVPDAFVPEDGNVPDAFMPDTDSGPDIPDAGTDAAVDPDAGSDAGTDAAVDPDAGSDAGRPDAGGFNSCSDELGICLRFENAAGSPSVTGWMINIIWTRSAAAGGGVIDTGWVSETCMGGIRRDGAFTTECRFNMPARPADATADLALVYLYPVYAGFVPACSSSSCPNYPGGYTIWKDMAVQTHSSESRSGTPAGTLFVLRTAI